MRARYVAAPAVVVVAALAAAGFFYLRRDGRTPAAASARPNIPAGDISVPATIRARHVVAAGAPIGGVLDEVLAEVGQPVYEGQVIARIRNTALDSAQRVAEGDLQQAEDRLNRFEAELAAQRLETSRARAEASRASGEFAAAEKVYLRQQLLNSKGATPRLTFEKAEQEYRERRAERDTREAAAKAAEQLSDDLMKRVDAARAERDAKAQELDNAGVQAAAAEVKSPADGVLVALTRAAGDEVTPEMVDLVQVAVNVAELEAVAKIDPAAAPRVKPGDEALLTFAEAPDALTGKVREVSNGQVVVEFATPNPAIRPGMTAQMRLRSP